MIQFDTVVTIQFVTKDITYGITQATEKAYPAHVQAETKYIASSQKDNFFLYSTIIFLGPALGNHALKAGRDKIKLPGESEFKNIKAVQDYSQLIAAHIEVYI